MNKSNSKHTELKIEGFRFNYQLMERMKMCEMPASSWVVFLTLLSDTDSRGILRTYSLSEWSETLGISYSTLYSGFKMLERCHFVEEVIINDLPYLKINEYEELNSSQEVSYRDKKSLNYFNVPRSLFDTDILKSLVHKHHVSGILFILNLFNRFRNAIRKKMMRLEYTMTKLKELLGKRDGKDIREFMTILKNVFDIEIIECEERKCKDDKMQIRVYKYSIIFRSVYLQDPDVFNFRQLMGKYGESLTHFLDTVGLNHTKKDTRDILIAFRQEVMAKTTHFEQKGDRLLRDIFMISLSSIEKQFTSLHQHRIKKLGAYFRVTFRDWVNKVMEWDTTAEERIHAYLRELQFNT
ncbi:hypothetical protein M3202_19615 [Alkalihalobacillus oceani]|uniref:Uncharacterized protein n=1 Tax=Halalkalibacter oceani TaxID=1653776 RepID=A0A9X2IQF7_9BACI|nr:hypothetical protein [Halalkalibacter oceani]MCM3716255.1 hypothetical protein [Halalkalibacter oceani]